MLILLSPFLQFALLGYFQRRLQMNGISFILSSGHEAPHHKCMMDASAQSEFSTHEALSVISHAKEREATKFVATTVCPNKFWLRSKSLEILKIRNL